MGVAHIASACFTFIAVCWAYRIATAPCDWTHAHATNREQACVLLLLAFHAYWVIGNRRFLAGEQGHEDFSEFDSVDRTAGMT